MDRTPETAVLLAAGRGVRLRPHTDRVPKPLLPVDGRPTLDYVLRACAVAGIRQACLVTHHLGEQIEAYVENGSDWGLQVACCRQPDLDGTARALQAAVQAFPEMFKRDGPILLSATDYALPAHYLADLLCAHAAGETDITVSLKQAPPGERAARSAVQFDSLGRITRIIEKPPPDLAVSSLVASLTFVLPGTIVDFLGLMEPSVRGEYEIQSVINNMLADGYTAAGLLQEIPPEWEALG